MIVLNIKIETNPGAVAALQQAIGTLEKLTRVEPGCVDYVFTTEINEPNTLRIIEHWSSTDALKAHLAQPHLAAFQAAMAKNPPKSMAVKMFDGKELPFPPK